MEALIRFGLPLYFLLYFSLTFLVTSWIVAKRIGKNPLVLPKKDDAYGFVGRYFKYVLIGIFFYTIFYAVFPQYHQALKPFTMMQLPWVQYVGIFFLLGSFVWTAVAQYQMHDSWRIGIDTSSQTALKTSGLFAISRNPVFLGMLISLLGLLLITPNSYTLLFLCLGYLLIQIQIRLEESFLLEQHEEVYTNYKNSVRRFV